MADLEPIAYFKHNGIMMAMTAHEAALYDNQAGGSLRKTMTSLTHKNLPLAMFLEYADMGFPAYTGATNKTCSNDTIITYLGMGIVWFTDPPEQPEPTDYDYEYRVDTDVITPVTLYAGSEINPDSPATVSFSINGSTYRMNNIVIPSGDSQIAWVKWHTPSEPQDITIYVSTKPPIQWEAGRPAAFPAEKPRPMPLGVSGGRNGTPIGCGTVQGKIQDIG